MALNGIHLQKNMMGRRDRVEKISFESVKTGTVLAPVVHTVNQETFWKNSVASFDYNPVHNDPEWVKTAMPFKIPKTVGHGMMTMSFMTSVVTNWAVPAMLKVTKVTAKFTKPVEQEWTITCTGVISEKHYISKGKNFIVVEVKAVNQAGQLVALGEVEVVFPD
jgi:acyl dehydratase